MPAEGWGPLFVVPVIAVVAVLSGAMRRSGATWGGFVGLVVAWGVGWSGVAMLGMLLVVGTFVSDKTRRGRGWIQAFCNGAVGAAAAVAAAFGAPWGAVAVAGAFSTALSDTAAGEIGRKLDSNPRILLFGPRVTAGRDGGMSWQGTAIGVAAAFLVPLSGWMLGAFDLRTVLWIAVASCVGNVADSVFGITLQKHLGPRGNDWVNLCATFVGSALAVALAAQ